MDRLAELNTNLTETQSALQTASAAYGVVPSAENYRTLVGTLHEYQEAYTAWSEYQREEDNRRPSFYR